MPDPTPVTHRDPLRAGRERCPAALAAAVLAASGLVAGYLRPEPALAILGLGAGAVGGRHGRLPARVWAIVLAFVGLRLVAAAETARVDARRWQALAAGGAERPVRAIARIERVRASRPGRWSVWAELEGCPRPCAGSRASFGWRDEPVPREGERWAVTARLAADPVRANPGARFPPAGLAPGARRGALEDVRAERIAARGIPLLATAEAHLRARIEARFDPALAPLIVALILGDRAGLDPDLWDAFANTGTLHILAVSGLHVGFLAGLLGLGLSLGGAGPRARAVAATLVLAGYAALVGARPSVVRAAAMAAALLWARAGERRVSTWQAWGAAATGILAWRPLDLFDLGFVLSFGAVAGLLALAGPWAAWLEGRPGAPDTGHRPGRLGRLVAGGLAATSAATAGTLPVQAAAFGWLAPAGFALNPLVVPLAAIGLPLVWAVLAADAVGVDPLAAPIAGSAALALGLLAALVTHAGGSVLPWVPGPAGWGTAAAVALALAALFGRHHPRAVAVALGASLAIPLAARPPAARGWEVTWLDVGQGDAVVLEFPDGATWLVDAGGADPFGDAGRRAVLPHLRRKGVRSLEWLITTHPDLDHVGGAASVVAGIPVRNWGSGGPVSDADAWLALLTAEGPGGRPVARRLRSGDRLRQGAVSVDVLHPGPDWIPADPYAAGVPDNEGSVVMLMAWRNCRLLLTGDLGRPGEEHLVAALGDSLRAGLLHVGHHGSRHSSTAAFLARIAPRDAVVSVGRRNRFGHPHPDALGRLVAAGARVHRTDRHGPVAARCEAGGWRLGSHSP